jgi:Helix-turn-helix domain of resolvase
MAKRGRKPRLSQAEQHELRRYREAGVSITRLASMWHVTPCTVHKILAAQRLLFGPEQLPENKKHLARFHLFTSSKLRESSPE